MILSKKSIINILKNITKILKVYLKVKSLEERVFPSSNDFTNEDKQKLLIIDNKINKEDDKTLSSNYMVTFNGDDTFTVVRVALLMLIAL